MTANGENHLLSKAQVSTYNERGYVIPDYRLPGDMLADMRRAYVELLARNPDISADFMLGPPSRKSGRAGPQGQQGVAGFRHSPRTDGHCRTTDW